VKASILIRTGKRATIYKRQVRPVILTLHSDRAGLLPVDEISMEVLLLILAD